MLFDYLLICCIHLLHGWPTELWSHSSCSFKSECKNDPGFQWQRRAEEMDDVRHNMNNLKRTRVNHKNLNICSKIWPLAPIQLERKPVMWWRYKNYNKDQSCQSWSIMSPVQEASRFCVYDINNNSANCLPILLTCSELRGCSHKLSHFKTHISDYSDTTQIY